MCYPELKRKNRVCQIMSNNYYINKYSQNYFIFLNKFYSKLLPKNKKIKILDLGCGDGNFIYFLNTLKYKNVTGIDNDKNLIKLAKNNLLKTNTIQLADVKKYLNKKNYFDLIILKDVIEHFDKSEIILITKKIYQKLNKNGVLIIQTVNGQSPFFGIRGFGDITHKTILTPGVLEKILNKYNFRTIEILPVRPQIYNLSSLFRKLIFSFFELLFKLFLLAENGSSNYVVTQNFVIWAKK